MTNQESAIANRATRVRDETVQLWTRWFPALLIFFTAVHFTTPLPF